VHILVTGSGGDALTQASLTSSILPALPASSDTESCSLLQCSISVLLHNNFNDFRKLGKYSYFTLLLHSRHWKAGTGPIYDSCSTDKLQTVSTIRDSCDCYYDSFGLVEGPEVRKDPVKGLGTDWRPAWRVVWSANCGSG